MVAEKQIAKEMDSIAELVELLKQNQKMESAANIVAMAVYVGKIDAKLDQLLTEVRDVQNQLKNIPETGNRTSMTSYLKTTVDHLSVQYKQMKEDLTQTKDTMKQKAGEIVKNVRKEGIKALNGVTEFFKIGERIKKIENKAKANLSKVDEMIERLDMFGKGMDEAKRQAVHSVNILKGKSEQQNVGSISSKMDVIKKPFIKEKEILENILQLTDNALNRCETLSQEAKGWYAGEFVQDEKTYHTSASLEKKTDDAIKRGLHKKRQFYNNLSKRIHIQRGLESK